MTHSHFFHGHDVVVFCQVWNSHRDIFWHLWSLKTAVLNHRCLIFQVPFNFLEKRIFYIQKLIIRNISNILNMKTLAFLTQRSEDIVCHKNSLLLVSINVQYEINKNAFNAPVSPRNSLYNFHGWILTQRLL